METRRLRAFIKMVDTGSLTRAAEVLGIAQPALSQQVMMMEADFGTQLLIRSRQGVSPTPAGRVLYRHAQIILRQLEQAHSEVSRAVDELSGTVHIGLPLTAAAMLSVPLLEAAAERYPNIVLFLADGLPGNLLNEFTMNGRVDIGVLPGNVSATGVTVRPLLRERLALVVAVDSELGQSTDPIGMKRLEGRALVLPESTNRVRQAVDAAFGSIGVVPTVVAEMNSVYSLVAAAVAKLGAAIVPAAAVVSDPRIVTRLLIEPEIERPLHIAYSNAAPLMPTVKAIFDLIIEVTERLVATGQWSAARLGNEGSS